MNTFNEKSQKIFFDIESRCDKKRHMAEEEIKKVREIAADILEKENALIKKNRTIYKRKPRAFCEDYI